MTHYEVHLNRPEYEAVMRAVNEGLDIALDCGEDYEYAGKLYSAKITLARAKTRE